jgi:hypothetical protein
MLSLGIAMEAVQDKVIAAGLDVAVILRPPDALEHLPAHECVAHFPNVHGSSYEDNVESFVQNGSHEAFLAVHLCEKVLPSLAQEKVPRNTLTPSGFRRAPCEQFVHLSNMQAIAADDSDQVLPSLRPPHCPLTIHSRHTLCRLRADLRQP